MYSRRMVVFVILFFLAGPWTCASGLRTAVAQVKPLTYPEIITALNAKLPPQFKKKSDFLAWLVTQIRERRVDKPLNSSREEDLRQAGASDEIIDAIRQNSPPMPTPTPVATPIPTPTSVPTPVPTPKADASVLIKQGNGLRDAGDYELSLKDYVKALEAEPQNADAFLNRGMAHHYLGDTFQALKDYRTAIKLKPELGAEDRLKCLLYSERLAKPDTGISACTAWINSRPDFGLAYYMRAVAYQGKYNPKEEKADYDKAIELSPKFPLPYLDRGLFYLNDNKIDTSDRTRIDRAVADINRVIAMYPGFGPAYRARGIAYGETKEFEKAIAEFNRYFELTPRALLNCVSLCYPIDSMHFFGYKDSEKVRRSEALVNIFDKLILANPANIYNYMGRDRVLFEWGATKSLLDDNFKPNKLSKKNKEAALVDAKPQTAQDYLARAQVYGYGRLDDAEKSLTLDKEFASAYFYYAMWNNNGIDFSEEKFDRSAEYMAEAIRLAPELTSEYSYYSTLSRGAKTLFDRGKYEKALPVINRLIDTISDPMKLKESLLLRANIYEKIGKQDLAAADRQRASGLK